MSQEERLLFWEITVSVILSKKCEYVKKKVKISLLQAMEAHRVVRG
jgi:hypothetical protein